MHINIGRRSAVILGVFILVAAGVISLSINKSDSDDMGGMSDHSGHMSTSTNSNYTGADVMFLQMMIPHHQQAVEMSELALKNSKDNSVIELAKQIKAAQAPEIEQMKSWLTKSGFNPNAPHNMMMAGMLSDAEISKLKQSKANAFDKLFLAGMIKHHEGALQMLKMISGSTNDEVKTLSENIASTQTIEIETMKAMLAGK